MPLKKKIIFLLPELSAGGAERVMATLASTINKSKFDVHLIAMRDGPVRGWLAPHVQVHILHAPSVAKGLPKLYQKLKELQPDVAISSIIHLNFALLLLKPFLKGVKVIVRESSMPGMLIRHYGWKGRLSRYLYQFLYPHADVVIDSIEAIKEEFQNDLGLPVHNHVRILNPVDTAHILSHVPSELPQGSQFISVGRLTFEKGFDRLIEALAKADLDYSLKIIGEGPERAKLEALIAKHNLVGKMELCGHKDNPWADVAAADCFLLSSYWEGTPNAALESLVCGTPVITTSDVAAAREIKSLCKGQGIEIAADIEGLIGLMSGVKPQNKKTAAPSLLPEEFTLGRVIEKFEALLT